MNCQEFENVAGALLEGDSHPEAYDHLGACPHCRLLVEDLSAIESAARRLPLVQPPDRLWARIAAAAAEEQLWEQPGPGDWLAWLWRPLPVRPAFVGELALLLAVAAAVVIAPSWPFGAPAGPPLNPFEVAQGELVQEAGYGNRYDLHLARMETQVLSDQVPVDDEVRQAVEGQLGTVDRAIHQTQSRLDSFPEDALARQELHRLYRQKADVLQTVSDSAWYYDSR